MEMYARFLHPACFPACAVPAYGSTLAPYNLSVEGPTMSKPMEPHDMPEYLRSAERVAQGLGVSVDELFIRLKSRALTPDYPSPECYLPDEVWEYQHTGRLPLGRESHVKECHSCRALLRTLVPD